MYLVAHSGTESLSSVSWVLVLSITWSHLVEMAEAWTGLDLNDIPLQCCERNQELLR